MAKLSCIIVEDEPLAAEILQDYIQQLPFIELKAVCTDAVYAMDVLKQQQIDVVFLDIHLPKLKGLDFLRTLKQKPQVIITTAYRDYALDGYELDVTDYLLKPISFNRFVMAVNKLEQPGNEPFTATAIAEPAGQYMMVNVNKKQVKIPHSDILYIESRKDYINIVTADAQYLTRMPISEIEQVLDSNKFLRVHRSFIIARQKVKAFTAMQLELPGYTIPIGRSYKERVLEQLHV